MPSPICLAAVLLCCGLQSIHARQSASEPDQSPGVTFHAAVNRVLVDVMALNQKTGRPEGQLTRQDFQLFDNGRLVPILSFDHGPQSRPLALWFVVQCNMRGWEKQGSGLFAGRAELFVPALQYLQARDTAGVAHWCDTGDARIDLPPTQGNAALARTIEHTLEPVAALDSHSRLGELGLQKMLQMIIEATSRAPKQPIPVIVFLYGDYSGMPKSEADHFVNSLLATSAIVFGLRDPQSPQVRELSWVEGEQGDVANYLAKQTGGEYFRVPSDEYASTLERILSNLHSRYELAFEPKVFDGKRHKLKVKLKGVNEPVQLKYRSGYVPLKTQ